MCPHAGGPFAARVLRTAGAPPVFWPGALQGGPLPGPESHPPPKGEILKTEIANYVEGCSALPKTPRGRDAGKGSRGPDKALERNLFQFIPFVLKEAKEREIHSANLG